MLSRLRETKLSQLNEILVASWVTPDTTGVTLMRMVIQMTVGFASEPLFVQAGLRSTQAAAWGEPGTVPPDALNQAVTTR